VDSFSYFKITVNRRRGTKFLNYGTFLPGACHDPHAYHGTWKKYCHALDIFGLGRLSRGAAAPGEVFAGKQEFGMLPQVL
jgi:hypothetical protein